MSYVAALSISILSYILKKMQEINLAIKAQLDTFN